MVCKSSGQEYISSIVDFRKCAHPPPSAASPRLHKLLCIEMKVPRYGNPIFALGEFITVWIIMCTHCIEDPALLHLNILQDQFAYDQELELPFIQYLLCIYSDSTGYGFRYPKKGKCIVVLFVLKSWSQVNSQLTMRARASVCHEQQAAVVMSVSVRAEERGPFLRRRPPSRLVPCARAQCVTVIMAVLCPPRCSHHGITMHCYHLAVELWHLDYQ